MMTFKLDTSRLNRALADVGRITGQESKVIVKEQARLLLERAQKGFTPPKNKKQGVDAIRGDLLGGRRSGKKGIIAVIKPYYHPVKKTSKAADVTLWVGKNGKVNTVDRELYRPNASANEIGAWHKRNYKRQNKRITLNNPKPVESGNVVRHPKMFVSEAAFNRYMAQIARRVGRLKAGWNKALRATGGKVQAFASGHDVEAAYGIFTSKLERKNFPSVVVGNAAPTISSWRKSWQSLIDTRARDMVKRARYLVKKAKKAGNL